MRPRDLPRDDGNLNKSEEVGGKERFPEHSRKLCWSPSAGSHWSRSQRASQDPLSLSLKQWAYKQAAGRAPQQCPAAAQKSRAKTAQLTVSTPSREKTAHPQLRTAKPLQWYARAIGYSFYFFIAVY